MASVRLHQVERPFPNSIRASFYPRYPSGHIISDQGLTRKNVQKVTGSPTDPHIRGRVLREMKQVGEADISGRGLLGRYR